MGLREVWRAFAIQRVCLDATARRCDRGFHGSDPEAASRAVVRFVAESAVRDLEVFKALFPPGRIKRSRWQRMWRKVCGLRHRPGEERGDGLTER